MEESKMRFHVLTLLCAALVSVGTAAAVEVPVSVSEPRGVARENQPATGGIPFKAGQVKDVAELALVDADGKAVAAQFTVLDRYADGSVRWVLVDFLCSVPAKGVAKYTLKTGVKNPAPKSPLKITQTALSVAFDTGAVSFTVSKIEFKLIENVKVGGKVVASKGLVDLANCELEEKTVGKSRKARKASTIKDGGETFPCKAGTAARVTWEYKGPVRATLRVDGNYIGKGGPKLSYTTRITAWAGCASVRVEHSIRNSDPSVGNDAFIRRAALTLDLAVDAKSEGAGADWAAGGDGKVGVLVQNRHTGGIYRGPGTYSKTLFGCGTYKPWKGLYGQKVEGKTAFVEIVSKGPTVKSKQGSPGFTQDGVFALADRAHKDSEVWLDFYTGTRDAATNGSRAKAFRSKLMLFAPGEWYSEAEGLGIGHFGTLADEKAVHKKWGWKDTGKFKKPSLPHMPDAYVFKEYIHDVSEDDCVEGYLLQFLRTGDRGFFDWADAWGGYYRCHAIERSNRALALGESAPKGKRVNKGLGFGWYGPHMYEWADSRMHRCHHYGRGIFDLYRITGQVDLLEAGLDLAAQVGPNIARGKPGGGFSFGRAWGRSLLTVISAWQATGDPKWKKMADHAVAIVLKAKNWDPELQIYMQGMGIKGSYFARAWTRGHFDYKTKNWPLKMFRPIPKRLDERLNESGAVAYYDRGAIRARKGKDVWQVTYLTQVFELSACHMALERYARLTDNAELKKRLVEVTEGVMKHYWSEKCHHMIGSPWFGWPEKGKVLDPAVWSSAHDKCPANGGGKHSGYATRYTADMCARAYSITKDPKWLVLARRSWNRGSKRLYNRKEQCAADDEIGPWAYIRGAHNNTMTESSVRMFYEVPRAK
jgi:exo-rhamnogalacturonan lyase-like protein